MRKSVGRVAVIIAAFGFIATSTAASAANPAAALSLGGQTGPQAGPEVAAPQPGTAAPADARPNPFNRDALISVGILGALTLGVLLATTTGGGKDKPDSN